MEQKSTMSWIIAGILAIAVIALASIVWHQHQEKQKDIDHVLSEGYENIALVRAQMQIKCEGPARNDAECEEALEDLAEILRDFGQDLSQASTTETEPAPAP